MRAKFPVSLVFSRDTCARQAMSCYARRHAHPVGLASVWGEGEGHDMDENKMRISRMRFIYRKANFF